MAASDAGRLDRREIPVVALLTLAALGLRFSLRDRYLKYDEAFTYFHYAASTAWTAIHEYTFPNNHIFHSLCLWASTRAFGLSVWTLRLPVFVFGVALVPLTYWLARQVTGPFAAAFATALAGGNATLAEFSVNARGYGMQAALFVAALALVPPLVRQPNKKRALALAVVLALALLTVPTLAFALATPFLWGIMLARAAPDRHRQRIAWLGVTCVAFGLLSLALYAPAIHFVLHERNAGANGAHVDSLSALFASLLDSFSSSLPEPLAWLALALVAAGTLIDGAWQRVLPLSVLWIGVPLAAAALFMLGSGRAPFARNFVFVIPLLGVLAARALEQLLLRARMPRPAHATSLGLAFVMAVLGWSATTTYAEHRRFMAHSESNTRYLFDHVLRPLRVGDDFALPGKAVVPLVLYARIEGFPLAQTQNHYQLSIVQRTLPDARPVASLGEPEQRFFLLEWTGSEREGIPSRLKAQIRKGQRTWIARMRFPRHSGASAVLWELARPEPE